MHAFDNLILFNSWSERWNRSDICICNIFVYALYLTMGHSLWKLLSIPAGYMVGVLCNYSVEVVWNRICNIDLNDGNNVGYIALEI